jgi:hypothetical protein
MTKKKEPKDLTDSEKYRLVQALKLLKELGYTENPDGSFYRPKSGGEMIEK